MKQIQWYRHTRAFDQPDFRSRFVRDVADLPTLKFIVLTAPGWVSRLAIMVVHLKPETESRLQELAATTGRTPEDLVEDAMSGYLAELSELRKKLEGRYDDIKGGRVAAIDGEDAFSRLRQISQDRRRA